MRPATGSRRCQHLQLVAACLVVCGLSPRLAAAEEAPPAPGETVPEVAAEPEPAAVPSPEVEAGDAEPGDAEPAVEPEPAAEPDSPSDVVPTEVAPGPVEAEIAAPAATEGEPPAEAVAVEPAEPTPELPRGTFVAGPFRFRPMLEIRERFETRIGPYTATGTGDDAYFVGSRARVGLDASLDPIRLLVQVADARCFGQHALGTDGGSTTGLHQGFFEAGFGLGWLRVGRQEVAFGHQRMIGPLNWTTAARSFDALRLHLALTGSSLDFLGAVTRWVARVTEVDESVDPPEESSTLSTGDYLAAIHYAWAALEAVRVDAYVLYRHDGAVDGNLARDRDVASPGIRLHGSPAAGFTYELEGVFQAGLAGGERHLALGAAFELAYTIQRPMRPRLALGGSYASGGQRGDALTELDNFFPTNHLFYGSADLFSWRNLIHGYLDVSAAPQRLPLTIAIAFHLFGLADPGSRWANAGGGTVGNDPDNEDRLLGYELDVNVGYAPLTWLKLALGYSVFIPAAAAENLGHEDPTHWAYFMAGSVLP